MDPDANDEPWKQTIISLQHASSSFTNAEAVEQASVERNAKLGGTRSRTSRPASHVPFSGYIRILERLSSTTISIYWYDATCGLYTDQIWKRTYSRHKTVCTVTGRPVERGDAVYRPYRRGTWPANANHSILACVLEASEGPDARERWLEHAAKPAHSA
ncbi:DUF3331 domain-containing protein [Paraburkholderia susongensis]|uniref:DUF3331 domain-containing protein n=1 Tax=Paraburkholderia susongensis TaxID=1515439 RepID=A0A1X7M4J4_9BURK|nr:DUF3331 domain-containing protein [Paraburkholderia susongensis]SMG60443.1 protein of unknown function [Paraburkholderia susongensis]